MRKIIFILLLIPIMLSAGYKTSQSGIDFITGFEGFRSLPYQDARGTGKVWTNGFGNTVGVIPGVRITMVQGKSDLGRNLRRFENHINPNLIRPVKQHEYDCLISFTYNCGYRFTGDLRIGVNQNRTEQVTQCLSKYVHAGGITLKGLVRRRSAECKLYKFGLY